jgi:hypothetical protein
MAWARIASHFVVMLDSSDQPLELRRWQALNQLVIGIHYKFALGMSQRCVLVIGKTESIASMSVTDVLVDRRSWISGNRRE